MASRLECPVCGLSIAVLNGGTYPCDCGEYIAIADARGRGAVIDEVFREVEQLDWSVNRVELRGCDFLDIIENQINTKVRWGEGGLLWGAKVVIDGYAMVVWDNRPGRSEG